MYLIIVSFLLFLVGTTSGHVSDQQSSLRDLVIILDDMTETDPSKGGSCLLSLTKALMAESVPFLVNASLWQVFLELRQEWLLDHNYPILISIMFLTILKALMNGLTIGIVF